MLLVDDMTHSISIAEPENLIVGSLAGTASLDGLVAYIQDLFKPPHAQRPYPILSDMRQLDMRFLSADDVRKVVELVASLRERIDPVRHAFLVSEPLSFGLARMYELLSQETDPQQIGVFYERGLAANWLAAGT